jgi:sterol desaturase/sphingolipid hydroxylase (fatty acid hydroxylase superfamily)
MIEYLTQHGHTILIDVFRLCVWLAILTIVFVPLERLFALHKQPILRAEIGADLGYYFLNGLVPAMLMSVPLGFLAWSVHRIVPHGFLAAVAAAPFWLRMFAGLVIGDIGYYWAHRCLHAVPLLWRFHAVHHSAQSIDFLVNTRAHPVDMVFGRMCGVVPLCISIIGTTRSMRRSAGTMRRCCPCSIVSSGPIICQRGSGRPAMAFTSRCQTP